jgi:hypothetical protein
MVIFPEDDEIKEILSSNAIHNNTAAGSAIVGKHTFRGSTLHLGIQLVPFSAPDDQDFQLFVAETNVDLVAMMLLDQQRQRRAYSKNGWVIYSSTGAPWGSVNFSLKADATTASNNGVSIATAAPIQNYWPLHHGDLRAGYGRDNGGIRDSCIALGTGTAVATIGGTFVDNKGNSYTVIGLRQERFRTSHLK